MSSDALNLDEVNSDSKSLTKINPKYQCMVSGEKRMEPCAGCSNEKGCVSRTMQYKETENVENMENAPVVIDSEESVEEKGVYGADRKPDKRSIMERMAERAMAEEKAIEDMVDEDMVDDEEDEAKKPAPKMIDGEEMEDEELPVKPEDEEEKMYDDSEEMDEETTAMLANRKKMRQQKLQNMGFKSADIDEHTFLCAFERKVYGGGAGVCASCPGGCAAEGSLPGLLDIEAIAEDTFGGKVLDSGYSDEADLFVVDLERKDGKPIEIFFDGESAECLGWHLLDGSAMNAKSAFIGENELVDFKQAAEVATKTIQGDVIAVDADVFEGFDAYAVEVAGLDGKSYDVFVSLDGEVLGYDEYSLEEAEDIEAEAAEIALKRAFSDEKRDEMAKKGSAMPDGSFPIETEDDLRNAISAYGRAKDKEAAKTHIIKRALDLKREDMIPFSWAPKKMRDEYQSGKKSDEDALLASLMEFELLAAETELKDIIGDESL